MEFLENVLKTTGWTAFATALLFALIGVVLILNPEGTIKVVSTVLSILFILIGVYKILMYFVTKGKYELYNYDMVYGTVAIVIGIVTIAFSRQILSMFRIIIGIWILYSAMMRITFSLKLRQIESHTWIAGLSIAIMMLVCGLFILFHESAILVTIGAVILIYSVLDMIESGIFIKNVKKIM